MLTPSDNTALATVHIILTEAGDPYSVQLEQSKKNPNRFVTPGITIRSIREWDTRAASEDAQDAIVRRVEAFTGIAIVEVTEISMVFVPVPSRIFVGYYSPLSRHLWRSRGMAQYPLRYGVFPYRFDDYQHLLLNGYVEMLEKDASCFSFLSKYLWETREWTRTPNLIAS